MVRHRTLSFTVDSYFQRCFMLTTKRPKPAHTPRGRVISVLQEADATRECESRPALANQRCKSPQVLSDGGQNKLILGASWTTQSKPTELKDALQVREPHLDLLALPP
jgi:hypothetical protein